MINSVNRFCRSCLNSCGIMTRQQRFRTALETGKTLVKRAQKGAITRDDCLEVMQRSMPSRIKDRTTILETKEEFRQFADQQLKRVSQEHIEQILSDETYGGMLVRGKTKNALFLPTMDPVFIAHEFQHYLDTTHTLRGKISLFLRKFRREKKIDKLTEKTNDAYLKTQANLANRLNQADSIQALQGNSFLSDIRQILQEALQGNSPSKRIQQLKAINYAVTSEVPAYKVSDRCMREQMRFMSHNHNRRKVVTGYKIMSKFEEKISEMLKQELKNERWKRFCSFFGINSK